MKPYLQCHETVEALPAGGSTGTRGTAPQMFALSLQSSVPYHLRSWDQRSSCKAGTFRELHQMALVVHVRACRWQHWALGAARRSPVTSECTHTVGRGWYGWRSPCLILGCTWSSCPYPYSLYSAQGCPPRRCPGSDGIGDVHS